MRKIYLGIIAIFTLAISNAQTATITSGLGNFSGNVGIGGNLYHASEHIYLESEIGAANFTSVANAIQKISFMIDPSATGTFPTAVSNFQVYMQNIASTSQTFVTGTYSLTGYTKVFDGTFDVTGHSTWLDITLSTPFVRTTGSNLQVLIIRSNGLSQTGLPFVCAIGNANNPATTNLTSRRYNGTAVPAPSSSSLAGSAFRSAIRLIKELSDDASLEAIVGGPETVTCSPLPFSYTVTIKNNSPSNTINAGAASVNLTFTGANAYTANLTNSASIAPNGTSVVTFSSINASIGGATSVRAVVTLSGDLSSNNDTIRTAFTNSPATPTSSYPTVESAEGNPLEHFSWIATLSGNRQLWGLRPGMKNTNLDTIAPFDGGTCYVFDSYSGTSSVGFTGRLFSNCFSFPANLSSASYYVRFRMSHDASFSTDLDSIYVSVSSNKGVSWTRLLGFQRYDVSFTTPGWRKDSVNLAAYAGQTIQLGFEGVSKYGNVMGLDYIEVNASGPLPVTLTSFTGKKEGRNNILSWSTANELNNKGFEILRSADGKNFSSIGFEASKNNTSTTATNYSFVDEKVLSGANYYQLKQIDKDGKSSLSNIVVLKSNTNKLEISTVYPNPANDKLNAIISSDKEEKVTVSITDLAGKVVSSQQVVTSNGSTNVFFNLQGLSKGAYLLRLTSTKNNEIQIEKFVKQ